MLTLYGRKNRTSCDGWSRRDFLRVGKLSPVGLALPDLLRMQSVQAREPRRAAAKNVLLIYLAGGQSHLDTFDPKPEAPAEIRGKFGVIPTKTPGVRYSDQLPMLAACSDLYALVRSQVSGSDHHETAAQWMLTGNYGSPHGGDFPAIGAVVNRELAPLNPLPPYVAIPNNPSFAWELGGAAWLGEQYESFKTGDPASAHWKAPSVALHQGVQVERQSRRQSLLDTVDALARRVESSPETLDHVYERAVETVLSPQARDAFDLSKESDRTREAYGKATHFGAQALLARRLIESEVRFVTLSLGGWDHHAHLFRTCDEMLRPWDQAVAALLRDMGDRGLLDETLVAVYGDFGRTARINRDGGRDHWPNAGCMLFAGAGIPGGQVIGKTDARGEYVVDRPVRPPEVAATIYHALGIDHRRALLTPDNRSVRLLPDTDPIHELFT
jgi:uncharacterized protein (DUF1501 family)